MSDINQQDMDVIFEEKRNELVSLLDKSESLVKELEKSGYFLTLPNNLKRMLESTRKRCHENLFEIVLIAQFQAGKSTTVGAFSDGREVSPRGLGGGGLKTSACIIKVQNIEKGDEEIAVVKWRSHEELIQRVDEILGSVARSISPELKNIYHKSLSEVDESERAKLKKNYLDKIDFHKPEGKSLLDEALKKEIKTYQDNPSSYPLEDLDLLRFAIIVLAYNNDSLLKDLRAKEEFSIEEIQDFIKFPENFNRKWEKFSASEFKIEEVMYAFIEEVTFKINSKNLERTGMVIVDAPGLFASNYDTQVAMKAMQKASAIWYLYTGERQPSAEDIKALKNIKKERHADKVFFGINYRRKPEIIKRKIEDEILATLQNIGFDKPQHQSLLYFNAFLALRAIQGNKLLNNNLDDQTKEQIILDAKEQGLECQTVEQAWLETTLNVIRDVKILTRQEERELEDLGFSNETVEIVRNKCGWYDVTEKIKKYVFDNKAKSVLIDLGCEPIQKILEDTKANLQRVEDDARKSEEEAEKEREEARNFLNNFIKESQQLIQEYIEDTWDIILADDFLENALFACIDEVARYSAKDIDKQLTLGNIASDILGNTWNTLLDAWNLGIKAVNTVFQQNLEQAEKIRTLTDEFQAIVYSNFQEQFNLYAQGWFNSLEDGSNKEYNEKIKVKVRKLCKEVKNKWNYKLEENIYLKGLNIKIPEFTGAISSDIKRFNIRQSLEEGLQNIKNEAGIQFFQDILGVDNILSGFGIALSFLPIDIIAPGLGLALTLVSAAIVLTVKQLQKKQRSYEDEIFPEISQALKKGFSEKQSEIRPKLKSKLSVIRNFYSMSIELSLKQMEDALNTRLDDSENKFKESQKERNEIARVASEVRHNHVEPLQEEMEDFKSRVSKIWS